MLEETSRHAEFLALAIAACGAAIVVYSVAFRRNIFVMAAGVLVAAAALVAPMLMRAPPVSVVIVKQGADGVAVDQVGGFYDGTYTSRQGLEIAVERERKWGRTATVIINDSDRLITVTAHQYSQFKYAPGRPQLLTYLLPGEWRVFPRRIGYTGNDRNGPPKTITSPSSVDVVIYLAYSTDPYDPNAPKMNAAYLEDELSAPPIYPRVAFDPPSRR